MSDDFGTVYVMKVQMYFDHDPKLRSLTPTERKKIVQQAVQGYLQTHASIVDPQVFDVEEEIIS